MDLKWISIKASEWMDKYMDLKNQGKKGLGFRLTADEEKVLICEAQKGNKDAETLLWLSKIDAVNYYSSKFSTTSRVKGLVDEEDEYLFNCATKFGKSIKNYDETNGATYTTYIMEIIKNAVSNTLREYEANGKDKRLNDLSLDYNLSEDSDDSFTLLDVIKDSSYMEEGERSNYEDLIQKYLAFLPKKAVKIIDLHINKGYKYNEIANMLGVTKQAVSSYIQDMQKFTRKLKEYAYKVGALKNLGATYSDIANKLELSIDHVVYYYKSYLFLEDKRKEVPQKPSGIWDPDKYTAYSQVKMDFDRIAE